MSTPETDPLYSGVAISTPSASLSACFSRSTGATWRLVTLGVLVEGRNLAQPVVQDQLEIVARARRGVSQERCRVGACTEAAGERQDAWHQLRTSSSWAITLTSFDRMNPPPGIGALNSSPNLVRSKVVVRSRPRRVLP